jgi:hypothetical protein
MKIIIEQFWQDLGEVEQRVQTHTKDVLKFLRDNNKKHILNGVTVRHEGILVEIKGITEDYCLDIVEVGLEDVLGMHIYEIASFDIYELLLLLRYIRDNVEAES